MAEAIGSVRSRRMIGQKCRQEAAWKLVPSGWTQDNLGLLFRGGTG